MCLSSCGLCCGPNPVVLNSIETDNDNDEKVLVIISAILMAACASPAVFKDPKTGQVAQCNASTPGVFPIIAQHEIDTCSDAYARMGWVKQ